MSKVATFLRSIGLSDTESQIYLYALANPGCTISKLARNTKIKRPTLYHALGTLEAKQLVNKTLQSGQYQYTAAQPEDLQEYLFDRANVIKQQQSELTSLLGAFPVSPTSSTEAQLKARGYQSIEGIKELVEKALNCQSGEWRIIAPRHNFFFEFDEAYADYFMQQRQAKHIKARSLWEHTDGQRSWRPLTLGEFATRKPRYLPESYTGRFKSVIIIFDDSAAFISSLKAHHALLVTSKDLTDTLKVMFDALWELSHENAGS